MECGGSRSSVRLHPPLRAVPHGADVVRHTAAQLDHRSALDLSSGDGGVITDAAGDNGAMVACASLGVFGALWVEIPAVDAHRGRDLETGGKVAGPLHVVCTGHRRLGHHQDAVSPGDCGNYRATDSGRAVDQALGAETRNRLRGLNASPWAAAAPLELSTFSVSPVSVSTSTNVEARPKRGSTCESRSLPNDVTTIFIFDRLRYSVASIVPPGFELAETRLDLFLFGLLLSLFNPPFYCCGPRHGVVKFRRGGRNPHG